MTLTPVAFNLTDVTLYVNTTRNLYTVNPYTGDYETDVYRRAPACLARTYNDIAMQSNGELYTFDSHGNYDQLNIGNAGSFRHQSERRHHLLSTRPGNERCRGAAGRQCGV